MIVITTTKTTIVINVYLYIYYYQYYYYCCCYYCNIKLTHTQSPEPSPVCDDTRSDGGKGKNRYIYAKIINTRAHVSMCD